MSFEEQAAAMTKEEIAALLSFNESLQNENLHLKAGNQKLETRNHKLEISSQELEASNQKLKLELDWFKRQLFGRKSEKRILSGSSNQLSLGEWQEESKKPPPANESVKTYQRKERRKSPLEGTPDDSGLRFDASKVPVETIVIPNPEIKDLSPDEYEVIGEKSTYRLAQRPAAYVVLHYKRETVKLKSTKELITPKAPASVLEKSYADVSLLTNLWIDKCLYHLPLYRQHQRISAAHIMLSRATLTNLVHRSADLLQPVYYALFSSVLQSKLLAMDETPFKAGRKSKGKMQQAYFWPIYGDKDEIVFPFSPSRGTQVVREALSEWCGTLISDGYTVYERFAEKINEVTHAQCWVHARRKFLKAESEEPLLVETVLDYIGAMYAKEKEIRDKQLQGEQILAYRTEHTKPIVDEYFAWLKGELNELLLMQSSPFAEAANYTLKREAGLRVFLQYPNVPLDTNHLERALRPIPMGKKNWLFCWTEVGAQYMGIMQSLLQSCKLQGVDPYIYLVDVLQRVETHPAREVHLLTPRLWKENFAEDPLTSDIA